MRERERAECADFVRARYSALYRTAYLLTGDHHAAENVVQSALTKLCLSWRRVQGAAEPTAYARRAVVNEAISMSRRRWTTERPSSDPDALAGAAFASGPDETATETQVVWQALSRLTRRQRAVLVLRHYEELTEAEIAQALGIAPGTVKGHARAALAALAAQQISTVGSEDREGR